MARDAFGSVLHSLRAREGMTQSELARQLHVHRNSVGAWERGDYLPDLTTVHEIARVLFLDEAATDQLFIAHSARSPQVMPWNLPALRNPFFTGRESFLQRLHEALQGQTTTVRNAVALCGLGGVGKSHTALEYAYRFQHLYRAIFWVHAETRETLLGSYLAIADLLELPEARESDHARVHQAVIRWLHTHAGWLLIYDNVEDLALLQQMLPAARDGAILLTTRVQATGKQFLPLEMEPPGSSEAIQLLLRRARLLAVDHPLETLPPAELAYAARLAEDLGYLPLALDQAGTYIEENGCSLEEYLALYRAYRPRLLGERGAQGGDHPASVEATVQLAVAQVQQRNSTAVDALSLCAVLAPDAIPQEMFWQEGEQVDESAPPLARDVLEFHALVKELRRASLLQRHPGNRSLSVHRLVQEVLSDAMDAQTRQIWRERAIGRLNLLFPPLPLSTSQEQWPLCEQLLPHILRCIKGHEQEQSHLLVGAQLCLKASDYLQERDQGQHPEAIPLVEYALAVYTQVLGPEHPERAQCLDVLGILHRLQGNYEQAQGFYEQSLAIRERAPETEQRHIAETLNNLAIVARFRGKNEEAAQLFERALSIAEHIYGPTHYYTITPMSLLAMVYADLGRYDEAETLQRRALTLYEQVYGPSYSYFAASLRRLAILLHLRGRYAEAESLLQRSRDIIEQSFGPDDIRLAHCLDVIGQLFLDLGRDGEAEAALQRALAIFEQRLGPAHPDSIPALLSLAEYLRRQGSYEQAREFGERVLAINDRAFGSQHPGRASALCLLAMVARDAGQFPRAETLFRQAVDLYEQTVAATDPRRVAALHAQGVLARLQGNYPEAEALLQQALALREERFGPHHPQIAESLAELARLYREQDRAIEAEDCASRALSLAEQLLGQDHPLTQELLQGKIKLFKQQQGV